MTEAYKNKLRIRIENLMGPKRVADITSCTFMKELADQLQTEFRSDMLRLFRKREAEQAARDKMSRREDEDSHKKRGFFSEDSADEWTPFYSEESEEEIVTLENLTISDEMLATGKVDPPRGVRELQDRLQLWSKQWPTKRKDATPEEPPKILSQPKKQEQKQATEDTEKVLEKKTVNNLYEAFMLCCCRGAGSQEMILPAKTTEGKEEEGKKKKRTKRRKKAQMAQGKGAPSGASFPKTSESEDDQPTSLFKIEEIFEEYKTDLVKELLNIDNVEKILSVSEQSLSGIDSDIDEEKEEEEEEEKKPRMSVTFEFEPDD